MRAPSMRLSKAITGRFSSEEPALSPEETARVEGAVMRKLKTSAFSRDANAPPPVTITWKGVSFSVPQRDPLDPAGGMVPFTILEPSSGTIPGGDMCAFMGPSGSGKSTLMDIIAKKKTAKHEGAVFADGHAVDDEQYPLMLAYVGQEDLMHQHCTVEQVVSFTAKMKRPRGADLDIDSVLEDMGLMHVKSTRIGGPAVRGISGGQRRRVSLARGVVACPRVMYLDEPTSGLSSTDAELCIRVLKKMALQQGITIVVVIHQPRVEVAELFNQLVLLTARPGRIVYDGPMMDVSAYYAAVGFPVPEGTNFADHIMDVITPGADGADPDAFAGWYQERLLPGVERAVEACISTPGPAAPEQARGCCRGRKVRTHGFWTEFWYVLQQELVLLKNDRRVIFTSIVVAWAKALILGVMFQGVGDTQPEGIPQTAFFFIVLLVISLGSTEQVVRLLEVRNIMKLEVDQRLYGYGAYILATTIVQVILLFTGSTLFLVTMFLFSGLGSRFFPPLFLWSSLVFAVFINFTAFVAAAAKNQPAAQAVALPGILVMVMFSGFYISKRSAPVYLKWLLYLSPVALSMEQMAQWNYQDDPAIWALLDNTYGYDPDASAWYVIAICVIAMVGFRIMQILSLVYLNRIQR